MGTCIVVVEQHAAGAVVWKACTPSLEDFGRANVDVPLGIDRLPLLEPDRGHMIGLAKKTAIICSEVPLDFLNFTGGFSPGKSQTEDCCLVSGS